MHAVMLRNRRRRPCCSKQQHVEASKDPTRRRLRLRFSDSNQSPCSALQLTFMQLAPPECNTLLARSHDRVTANAQRDRLQTDDGGERLPAAEREGIQIVGGGRRKGARAGKVSVKRGET